MRTISNTQVGMMLKCPRQYEFRYIKGLKIKPKGYFVQGSAYHGALQANFEHKIEKNVDLDISSVLDAYDTYWNNKLKGVDTRFSNEDEVKIESVQEIDWEDNKPNEMKDEGYRLVALYHRIVAPSVEPVSVEGLVRKKINENLELMGFIDLKTKDSIIDHKLMKSKMNEENAKKDSQVNAYCFLEDENDFEFHVAIKKNKPDIQIIKLKNTTNHVNWWLESVIQIAKQIDSGMFPPNNTNWTCSERFCGYWSLCQKMRPKIFSFGK